MSRIYVKLLYCFCPSRAYSLCSQKSGSHTDVETGSCLDLPSVEARDRSKCALSRLLRARKVVVPDRTERFGLHFGELDKLDTTRLRKGMVLGCLLTTAIRLDTESETTGKLWASKNAANSEASPHKQKS
jgi:hypothetical protein